MQGSIVDLVLLALLIVFFGLQQRGRPQLLFRFWFTGWVLVFLSVLLWNFRVLSPHLVWLQEQVRLDSLLLGGMAFVLSFLARGGRVRPTLTMGVVTCAPVSTMKSKGPAWLMVTGTTI